MDLNHLRPITLLLASLLLLTACGDPEGGAPADGASKDATPDVPASKAAPPTLDTRAAKVAYGNQCLACHGATGAGDGSMVAALRVKPRSFASDTWRFVDFTAGDTAVRAEVARVIREGIPDAMMPGYASSYSEDEIAALTEYVLTLRHSARGG